MQYDGVQVGGKFDSNGVTVKRPTDDEDQKENKIATGMQYLMNNIGNFLASGNMNPMGTGNSGESSAFRQ